MSRRRVFPGIRLAIAGIMDVTPKPNATFKFGSKAEPCPSARAVDRVLAKALNKSPKQRYVSCGVFVRGLEAALGKSARPAWWLPAIIAAVMFAALAGLIGLQGK